MSSPIGDDLTAKEYYIPSVDDGIRLYLRNKHRKAQEKFSASRTLLFVHGGTQAAEATFDLALDGYSWMDFIAHKGWDVWFIDIRGFGKSTRPAAMELPIDTAPPVARTIEAWSDFGAAVSHILELRGIDRLNALGWSWGTLIAAGWASLHPDKVSRLALFGAAWNPTLPTPASKPTGYVRWTVADAFARLRSGVPTGFQDSLTPSDWYKSWEQATIATDPQAHLYYPPQVRSPAGAFFDLWESASSGKPIFEPARITAATLLVTGEWDALTDRHSALALFDKLSDAREKCFVELGGATHFAHLEIRRGELFDAVQSFLDRG